MSRDSWSTGLTLDKVADPDGRLGAEIYVNSGNSRRREFLKGNIMMVIIIDEDASE